MATIAEPKCSYYPLLLPVIENNITLLRNWCINKPVFDFKINRLLYQHFHFLKSITTILPYLIWDFSTLVYHGLMALSDPLIDNSFI